MKYILMMNFAGKGPYQIASWPEQDIKNHIGFMRDLHQELQRSGELVSAEGLAGPDQAKVVTHPRPSNTTCTRPSARAVHRSATTC